MFWSIVLAVLAVVLLFAWRHDRKHRGRLKGPTTPEQTQPGSAAKAEAHIRNIQGNGTGFGG